MRVLVALIFACLPALVVAQEWEDVRVFNPEAGMPGLRILSSTDTAVFAPFVKDFLADAPELAVEYLVTSTADVDRRFRENPGAFDLVVSSAMDLQLKLTNDGYATLLRDVDHPDHAQWRHSLFGFTAEPAAIVVNRQAFAGHVVPRTRQDLIEALRARPETFRGRVGTYDVRQSGLGYLFATQDARASETFWRLMEVIGALDARLYCCSGDMIDDLASGKIAVAYNVLGSYAAARTDHQNAIEIILPADFPTTMMRTVLVSRDAPNPEAAADFLRHLISERPGANRLLPPLRAAGDGATIVLEPALITFLDDLKRAKFITEWEDAVIQR